MRKNFFISGALFLAVGATSLPALVIAEDQTLFSLFKTHSSAEAPFRAGDRVLFTAFIFNDTSETIADARLSDVLLDSAGTIIAASELILGPLLPFEEVEVAYGVVLGEELAPGEYMAYTSLSGRDSSGSLLAPVMARDSIILVP